MSDDEILTLEEIAKYLRVSERTIYDCVQKGEIPAGKIRASWRFKKSEIDKWVNEKLTSGSLSPVNNSPAISIGGNSNMPGAYAENSTISRLPPGRLSKAAL